MSRVQKSYLSKAPDFSYYAPINRQQEEFHASLARHRLLLGGYGGGKTYPSIHESGFHGIENPGHQFAVWRNNWDDCKNKIWPDYKDIFAEAGCIVRLDKTNLNMHIAAQRWNVYGDVARSLGLRPGSPAPLREDGTPAVNGAELDTRPCVFMFRPLSLERKKVGGYNLCGFHVDDPDSLRHYEMMAFLLSRLRDKKVIATRHIGIWTANYEGRDWLWNTFIKDREPGGDGPGFAYWWVKTTDNPTLKASFIEDQAAVHSEQWMKKYIYMEDVDKLDIGLIYHMLRKDKHNITDELYPKLKREGKLITQRLVIDVGNPCCVLHMGCSEEAIYVFGETYAHDWQTSDLAKCIKEKYWKQYGSFRNIIDPASAGKSFTSGTSPRAQLQREHRIVTIPAENEVLNGIRSVQDLLKSEIGVPRLYINWARCPKLIWEAERYHWRQPSDMDMDNPEYRPEPVKRHDHAMDCMRYGVADLRKYLKGIKGERANGIMEYREKMRTQLPFYKENKGMGGMSRREQMRKRSIMADVKRRRATEAAHG